MTALPELTTDRLHLRPFTLADAPIVQRLVGDRAIADTTLNIPHPYEEDMAKEWIVSHQPRFERGEGVNFAIVRREDEALIGAIGLMVNPSHDRAELGYWIGKEYWSQGYCTEAARAVLHYGFTAFNLNRIFAHHFSRNPASGRVMEKIGMKYEGCLRQHVKKWDVYEDMRVYGILKSEYKSAV
jgi:[ribosomal protein S5]-alanine N-acetyltransferase